MTEFRDAYGKHAGTPEEVYQYGYMDGKEELEERVAELEAQVEQLLVAYRELVYSLEYGELREKLLKAAENEQSQYRLRRGSW